MKNRAAIFRQRTRSASKSASPGAEGAKPGDYSRRSSEACERGTAVGAGWEVQAYPSAIQRPDGHMAVVIKTLLAPETLIAAERQKELELDPERPIYHIRMLAEMRADSIAPQRLNLTLPA
jgi:hypothetical protein